MSEVIGIGPPNHGADPFAYLPPGIECVSCIQFTAGSVFLSRLNSGTEVPGRHVDYTVLQSTHDQYVIPLTSGFLRGPRGRLTNITLQDRCLQDVSAHFELLDDPVVLQWIIHALDRRGPADPNFRPSC